MLVTSARIIKIFGHVLNLCFWNDSEEGPLNILGVHKLIHHLICFYRVDDFNLTTALLNNTMSDEYLRQRYIASYSWQTPWRKFKSFGLFQGHRSFD